VPWGLWVSRLASGASQAVGGREGTPKGLNPRLGLKMVQSLYCRPSTNIDPRSHVKWSHAFNITSAEGRQLIHKSIIVINWTSMSSDRTKQDMSYHNNNYLSFYHGISYHRHGIELHNKNSLKRWAKFSAVIILTISISLTKWSKCKKSRHVYLQSALYNRLF